MIDLKPIHEAESFLAFARPKEDKFAPFLPILGK